MANPFPSIVVYRGRSFLDGQQDRNIMAVLSWFSNNRKTGDAFEGGAPVAQLWILPADQHPMDAVNDGGDAAICGNCTHRYEYRNGEKLAGTRTCYVALNQGVGTVWQAAKDKPVTPLDDQALRFLLSRHFLRLGAYGDPAALPFDLVADLVGIAGTSSPSLKNKRCHTGYSHAWKTCDQRFASLLMASCERQDEIASASALGWRVFYTAMDGQKPSDIDGAAPFSLCMSANERAKKIACNNCRLCDGKKNDTDARHHIFIAAHGNRAVMANVARKIEAMAAPFPTSMPPKAKKSLAVLPADPPLFFDVPHLDTAPHSATK